ncbi:MAG: hypothetical protein QXS66_07105 [Thermoproteota archaeon]|nr:hypothetical protein [Candidatus Brockarchaeota archaeon]
MVDEAASQSSGLLHEFTANLIKIFEIRGTILGKLDLQKTVYFMKRLGVRVPFEFRWNLLGPYSYELAHYCTHLEIEGVISYSGNYKLNEKEAEKYRSSLSMSPDTLERVKRFFDKMQELCEKKGYDRVHFIECAASLDFISQNITTEESKHDVFSLLEKLKPEKAKIFKEMREDAWKFLRSEKLVEIS